MNIKAILKQENIIHIILFIAGVVVAIFEYGISGTIQTIAIFYCIIQLVFNLTDVYLAFKAKFKKRQFDFDKRRKNLLVVTTIVIAVLYFILLIDYSQRFVLAASGVTLFFLLVYDIGRGVLKKIF